ncbi:MAG: PorT family protein [Prevotellaceae bacterium]|jgi:hypothetical protein|nr:PorT family protein [Prevotellaceae bacterium]
MFKKVLVVIAIAILTAGSAQAQLRFGARAGFNLTNLSGDVNNTKFKPGFQIGAVGDYSINEAFAIQPGLVFATQGCAVKETGYENKMTLNYLQVPINAQYKLNLGGKTLLLQAGPYLGFGLGGKEKGKEDFDGDGNWEDFDEKIKMGSGNDADFKTFDFGIGLGAGIQFGNIQAGLGYNLGLANINNGTGSIKNGGLAITLTYLFGK